MFSIGLIVGIMIGGIVAIALHCIVIVGKEEDSKWEEEQITRNAEKARQEAYKRLAQKAEEKSRQYMNSNANRILEMTPRSANNSWSSFRKDC